jgi:hypothetical protein
MRSLFAPITTLITVLTLTACATQTPAPASPPVAAEKKGPQCWSGDHSKFFDVGSKTTISGVSVECKPTSDGKAAQWMGAKH